MPAYTVWPALESLRAVSAPNPLDAPVMTIVCFMICSFQSTRSTRDPKIGVERRPPYSLRSDGSAVGAQHLPVDPPAVGAGQEGDATGDILGRPQPLQRIQFCQATHD